MALRDLLQQSYQNYTPGSRGGEKSYFPQNRFGGQSQGALPPPVNQPGGTTGQMPYQNPGSLMLPQSGDQGDYSPQGGGALPQSRGGNDRLNDAVTYSRVAQEENMRDTNWGMMAAKGAAGAAVPLGGSIVGMLPSYWDALMGRPQTQQGIRDAAKNGIGVFAQGAVGPMMMIGDKMGHSRYARENPYSTWLSEGENDATRPADMAYRAGASPSLMADIYNSTRGQQNMGGAAFNTNIGRDVYDTFMDQLTSGKADPSLLGLGGQALNNLYAGDPSLKGSLNPSDIALTLEQALRDPSITQAQLQEYGLIRDSQGNIHDPRQSVMGAQDPVTGLPVNQDGTPAQGGGAQGDNGTGGNDSGWSPGDSWSSGSDSGFSGGGYDYAEGGDVDFIEDAEGNPVYPPRSYEETMRSSDEELRRIEASMRRSDAMLNRPEVIRAREMHPEGALPVDPDLITATNLPPPPKARPRRKVRRKPQMSERERTRQLNLAQLKRFAGGGHISGPGGGLDDLINTNINGRVPAKLSDGEFVIPSDVVSSIGDGSSNAGHRTLYDLIKEIRKQKYGRNKQPEKLSAGLMTLLDQAANK